MIATRCGGCGIFQPWVIIAVEVAADRHDDVGLVPERADLRHMWRSLDKAGVARRQQPAGGVGEDHRSHEPLGEPRHGLAGARLKRAAAGPDERPPSPLEQLGRPRELARVGLAGVRPLSRPDFGV